MKLIIMVQLEVFWYVTPCNVVVEYQRFIGTCCLHLHYMASQLRWPQFESSPS